MADTHETIADIIAEMHEYAQVCRVENWNTPPEMESHYTEDDVDDLADRLEAAIKRERVLAVSIMRSKLYGIAGGLRAITARSDARQRGIHYTEVQNIAAQIENIADNGGEA